MVSINLISIVKVILYFNGTHLHFYANEYYVYFCQYDSEYNIEYEELLDLKENKVYFCNAGNASINITEIDSTTFFENRWSLEGNNLLNMDIDTKPINILGYPAILVKSEYSFPNTNQVINYKSYYANIPVIDSIIVNKNLFHYMRLTNDLVPHNLYNLEILRERLAKKNTTEILKLLLSAEKLEVSDNFFVEKKINLCNTKN